MEGRRSQGVRWPEAGGSSKRSGVHLGSQQQSHIPMDPCWDGSRPGLRALLPSAICTLSKRKKRPWLLMASICAIPGISIFSRMELALTFSSWIVLVLPPLLASPGSSEGSVEDVSNSLMRVSLGGKSSRINGHEEGVLPGGKMSRLKGHEETVANVSNPLVSFPPAKKVSRAKDHGFLFSPELILTMPNGVASLDESEENPSTSTSSSSQRLRYSISNFLTKIIAGEKQVRIQGYFGEKGGGP